MTTRRSSDPLAEKEALLTAVLQSARTVDPSIDEDPAAETTTGEQQAVSVEPEHVALREVQPGEDEDEPVTPHRDAASDDADEPPTGETQPDKADVATSLVEAFDESQQPLRHPESADPSALDERRSNGTEIGQDTAEDLAALLNAPTPWDRAPADTIPPPSKPEPEPAPPTPTYDTAEDLAALFNAPTPWDRAPADTIPPPSEPEPAPPTPTYDTAEDLAALFNAPTPWDRDPAPVDSGSLLEQTQPDFELERSDEFDPATYRDRSSDLGESTYDPAGTWDDDRNATYSPAEWPWVSKSGDGGFWAPPRDHRGTMASSSGFPTTRPGATAEDMGEHHTYGTGEQPVVGAEGTGEAPAATPQKQSDAGQASGSRLRTAFHELGAWTAVAQVALLAVGMLCIIQVFVLIVVSSYLGDARESGGDAAIGSLSAHAKVDAVMLPALLIFAILAFAFAAWRSVATRSSASDDTRVRVLGLPITLWPVLFMAIMLLLVVIPATPGSVIAAQRITRWAMFACVMLGVACFVAPRSLDVPPPAMSETSARRRKGDASGGGIIPPTGSRSAA